VTVSARVAALETPAAADACVRFADAGQEDQLDGILTGVQKIKTMRQACRASRLTCPPSSPGRACSNDIHTELDLHAHLLTDLDGAVEVSADAIS
jgi:hypothetical protein